MLKIFAGGLIIYEIISKTPVLRWCILGWKKGEIKCLKITWNPGAGINEIRALFEYHEYAA